MLYNKVLYIFRTAFDVRRIVQLIRNESKSVEFGFCQQQQYTRFVTVPSAALCTCHARGIVRAFFLPFCIH